MLLPGTACMPSVRAGSLAEMFVGRSRWSSSQSPLTACSPYVSATERHMRAMSCPFVPSASDLRPRPTEVLEGGGDQSRPTGRLPGTDSGRRQSALASYSLD